MPIEVREVQRVKIMKIMNIMNIMNKVSYADALKKVRVTEAYNLKASEINQSAAQREYNAPGNQAQVIGNFKNVCTHKCKVNDDSLVVNKINCVAFICHTINVAAQLKKQSDRIKTIVEAAGQFLDMRY